MKSRFVTAGLLVSLMTWMLTTLAVAATIAPPKKASSKSRKVTESATTQKRCRARSTAHAALQGARYARHDTKSGKRSSEVQVLRTLLRQLFALDQAEGITAGETRLFARCN